MQNLFHMKRLSLQHQRYCFHKGVFSFFFFISFFFPYKASGERNSVILSYHAKRKFRITVCSIRMAPPPKALIIFWNTYPPVKDLQEGLRVGTLVTLRFGFPVPLHPASSRLIKRASRVAIVILSCWVLRYLEGNQMRTRSGEHDGVNVRQPKVICALCLEMFWYAEARKQATQTRAHCGSNLMFGF